MLDKLIFKSLARMDKLKFLRKYQYIYLQEKVVFLLDKSNLGLLVWLDRLAYSSGWCEFYSYRLQIEYSLVGGLCSAELREASELLFWVLKRLANYYAQGLLKGALVLDEQKHNSHGFL